MIAPAIVIKLGYVYRLIHRFQHSRDMVDEAALKSMVALLKKGVAA